MKELRNSFRWMSPPDAKRTARKIPEGSTVRRRLFADDGPAEPSGNPNTINSADDVARVMLEDMERAARRYGFDVQGEEPIPNDALSGMPSNSHGDTRKRRMLEAIASRQKLIETENRLRKFFEEAGVSFIDMLASLDNTANYFMDDTSPNNGYFTESVQHWNFDFDNKMPAAGAVFWQQVGSHWVGNKPETFTRLVLYPTKTENGVNTSISHEKTHEELTKGKADESVLKCALKPTDEIEHLLSENVYAIYGDWKREMKIGKKSGMIITDPRVLDIEFLDHLRIVQNTHQHHLITKSEAIALIRAEN